MSARPANEPDVPPSGQPVLAFPDLVVEASPAPEDAVRLAASRCPTCGRHEFPARLTCPSCLTPSEMAELGPSARLAGFTSVLHPPPGAKVPVPYHVGVAAFEEGISVMGLLSEVDGVELGDELEVVARPFDGERLTYAFRPVGASRIGGGAR